MNKAPSRNDTSQIISHIISVRSKVMAVFILNQNTSPTFLGVSLSMDYANMLQVNKRNES